MSPWKSLPSAGQRVGGVWKDFLGGFYKVGGVWKKFFPDAPANIIVLFKSVPGSPWMVVSSPVLNDKYGKCHTAQGSAGGANTHVHAYQTLNTTYPTSYTAKQTGIYHNMMYGIHTHTCYHGHTAATNHEPPWFGLCPASGGFPIPTTGYIFYDGFVDPDGWESDSALFNKYIKFKTSSPGGTGGNGTHQHSITLNTNAAAIAVDNSGAGADHQRSANHAHTANHTHTTSNNLYYYSLRPIHPIAETTVIPSGAVAFFIGSVVPGGWTQLSAANNRYIKMMSYAGATGGDLTHSEPHGSMYTGYYGATVCNPRSDPDLYCIPGSSHRHVISASGHTPVSFEPIYQQLLICKKN